MCRVGRRYLCCKLELIMGELLPGKSERWPWLDATEEAKFVEGTPGEIADRWSEKPNLDPCWRGAERQWNIETAESYQSQLWCPFWKCFINPCGFTCKLCKDQTWPEIENFRAHILPGLDKAMQEQMILAALVARELTDAEALELGKEFGL